MEISNNHILENDEPDDCNLSEELSSDPNLLAMLKEGVSVEQAVLLILEESAQSILSEAN